MRSMHTPVRRLRCPNIFGPDNFADEGRTKPTPTCMFRLSFPNDVRRIKYKGDSVTQPFISMHTLVRARIIYGILSNALFIFLSLHLYHRSLTFWFL